MWRLNHSKPTPSVLLDINSPHLSPYLSHPQPNPPPSSPLSYPYSLHLPINLTSSIQILVKMPTFSMTKPSSSPAATNSLFSIMLSYKIASKLNPDPVSYWTKKLACSHVPLNNGFKEYKIATMPLLTSPKPTLWS